MIWREYGRITRASLGANHWRYFRDVCPQYPRGRGLPQTPVKEAFADAIAWFRANGYAKR